MPFYSSTQLGGPTQQQQQPAGPPAPSAGQAQRQQGPSYQQQGPGPSYSGPPQGQQQRTMGPASSMPGGQGPVNQSQAPARWQPQQAPQQAPAALPQMPTPQQAPGANQQSVEQAALAGGGDDPQRVQDFMSALRGVGAGSNNAQMQNTAAPVAAPTQLLGAPAANNGTAGSAGYFGGLSPYAPPTGAAALFGGQQQPQGGAGMGNLGGMQSQGAPPPPPPPQQQGYASGAPQMGLRPSGAAGLLVSDENLKTAIRPGAGEISSFLKTIGAHAYEYKDERDGRGTFVGPMAQELERHPLGASAVVNTPRGKMVETGRLVGINLAASSLLDERVSKIERELALRGKPS